MSVGTDILSLLTPAKISPGGEAYFTLPDARKIAEECPRHDAVVLGMEVFMREGEFIRPQSDKIFDASDDLDSGKSPDSINAKAWRFLQQLSNDPDLLVNFVIVDAPHDANP
jgi:hypothetical protein